MDKTLSVSPPAALKALQALADENRLRIVEALRDGERCVCELQADLGLGQSLLSHHLRTLRESGLVLDRKEGRWVHYSLSDGTVEELESYLRGLREDAAVAEPRSRGCSLP
ncbi:MAG: metalloregulator ArsR/SmtB family transcription factor [Gemmatimonadetes bacterium]|nr:metalloregulator ArsR/SmtB family transcription factor [Gemmatimonadota bacterium]